MVFEYQKIKEIGIPQRKEVNVEVHAQVRVKKPVKSEMGTQTLLTK